MNTKQTNRMLFLLLTTCFILNSCVFDTMPAGYGIRNYTNDTLLIELTEFDNLDSCWMYWGKRSKDTCGIQPDETTVVYVHGEKVIFSNYYYTLPDSVLYFWPNWSNLKDTCYIYAIKWQVATHYTLDEIRAKKLYDRQAVTKRDFHKRLFEYRLTESNGD